MINRRALIASSLLPFAVQAMPNETRALIEKFTGGKPFKNEKITLDLNPLIENGNSVVIKIKVDYPFENTHYITRIALFTEKNPQLEAGEFFFTPFNGKAEITTRIRLASSQALHAIAESSRGEYFYTFKDTIVTLAACLEE